MALVEQLRVGGLGLADRYYQAASRHSRVEKAGYDVRVAIDVILENDLVTVIIAAPWPYMYSPNHFLTATINYTTVPSGLFVNGRSSRPHQETVGWRRQQGRQVNHEELDKQAPKHADQLAVKQARGRAPATSH